MNPIETLTDIYEQIAEIKLWICEQDNAGAKDKILSFASFTLDGLNQQFQLEENQQFADRINQSLSDLFYFHSLRDNHEYFMIKANQQLTAFSRLVGLALPQQTVYFHLISCLVSLAQIPFLSSVTIPVNLGTYQGVAEIDLEKSVKYISLQVVEYPHWVHRQFYYLPVSEVTLAEGIKAFFWSTKFNGFLDYRIPVLSNKTVLTKPENADKLFISATEQFKINVTLWHQW
jgi:hypothetical protein